MKTIEMSQAPAQLRDYLRAARREPLLVTLNGKPYVTLAAASTETDLENLAVAMHPKFQAIMERSERRWREEGGLTSDEVRDELRRTEASKHVGVEESSTNLPAIAESITKDETLRDRVRTSDVVLAPNTSCADYPSPVFPSHTRELFQFLRAHAPASLAIEVASTDQDYREVVLHSDLWALPMILFTNPFAGEVLIELVSNYIYDGLRRNMPGRKVEVDAEFVMSGEKSSLLAPSLVALTSIAQDYRAET